MWIDNAKMSLVFHRQYRFVLCSALALLYWIHIDCIWIFAMEAPNYEFFLSIFNQTRIESGKIIITDNRNHIHSIFYV